MNYDIHDGVADAVKAYLTSVVDAPVFATCPMVTGYDPMALDEADRVIIDATDSSNVPPLNQNREVGVKVLLQTQWSQATLAEDRERHKQCAHQLINALTGDDQTLADTISTFADGFNCYAVDPKRNFSKVTGSNNWIVTEIRLTLFCYPI